LGNIPNKNTVVFLFLKAKEHFMFSFFSVNRLNKFLSVGFVLLVMVAVLGGCSLNDNDFVDDNKLNSGLVGTWRDYWGSGLDDFDGYIITETHLTYGFGDFIAYKGTIRYVSNFSASTGVIIIEYDEGYEATYVEYDEDWNYVDTHDCIGNFVGIYFKNLKSGSSVEMSQAINIANNLGAEKLTLEAAKAAFTSGNSGNYVSFWGGPYLKQ